MSIDKINKAIKEKDFSAFFAVIKPFSKDLSKFAKAKLKNAEHHHLLQKGFYNTEDILMEVYLEVFEALNDSVSEKELKTLLFQKTIQKFNEILEKENRIRKRIPVDLIVKEELDLLNEDYSVDGNGHFVLIEELPDISYHQKDFKPKHYIIDPDAEKEIVSSLELDDTILVDDDRREKLANTYFLIPPTSKTIFELYVFGNQDEDTIAEILKIEKDQVKTVITKVVEKFKAI
jgi:DNA-directed RNA polymerase specialized sigma24 family protein